MDAFLFMILALVLVIKEVLKPSSDESSTELSEAESITNTERVAKLNDMYYEDPDAFSEIIHALGFPKR